MTIVYCLLTDTILCVITRDVWSVKWRWNRSGSKCTIWDNIQNFVDSIYLYCNSRNMFPWFYCTIALRMIRKCTRLLKLYKVKVYSFLCFSHHLQKAMSIRCQYIIIYMKQCVTALDTKHMHTSTLRDWNNNICEVFLFVLFLFSIRTKMSLWWIGNAQDKQHRWPKCHQHYTNNMQTYSSSYANDILSHCNFKTLSFQLQQDLILIHINGKKKSESHKFYINGSNSLLEKSFFFKRLFYKITQQIKF